MRRRLLLPALVALAASAAPLLAQVDTAPHKALYKDVNARLDSLQKVKASVTGPDGPIRLTGWMSEDGTLLRIDATPGNAGGTDEIYLQAGQPLFVFTTRKNSETGKTIEERLYFADGAIAQWLSTDKTFVPHGEDYAGLTEKLLADTATYAAALQKAADGKAPQPAKAPAGKTTTGTFLGIEQGDYAHWKMRTAAGEEISYFLLKPDAALERVLADPQEYEGRKCRVGWKTSVEDLESAGGKVSVDQILTVDWL